MFEYIWYLITSIDLMGTSYVLSILALTTAIGLGLAEGKMEQFYLITLIINVALATMIFVQTKTATYLIITALFTTISMLMPGNALTNIFARKKE